MKRTNRLVKNTAIAVFVMAAIIAMTVSMIGLYFGEFKMEYSGEVNSNAQNQYVLPLIDRYDSGDKSVNDFLDKEDSYDVLCSIYNDLVTEKEGFKYYPVTEPSIYYVGKYSGPESSIVGGEECRNEYDGSKYLTGLNTFESSKSIYDAIDIKIEEGRAFEVKDFEHCYSDSIPVILGSAFKKDFEIGDEISIKYYLSNSKLKVVGFLKEGASFSLGDTFWGLDDYVLLPEVLMSENEDNMACNTIIMMDRCECYMAADTSEQMEECVSYLKGLNEKYDFEYDITLLDSLAKEYEPESAGSASKETITNSLSDREKIVLKLILVFGIMLFMSCLYLIVRRYDKEITDGVNMAKLGTWTVIRIAVQFQLVYLCSYAISLRILQSMFENHTNEYCLMLHGNIRVGILIVVIVLSIILCRKMQRKGGVKA